MDKDQKPQPSNDRPAEKKPTPQTGGGNLVWYMLGLGVLLLLMVTLFNSGNELRPGWSDLIKLVEASGKDASGKIGEAMSISRTLRTRRRPASEFPICPISRSAPRKCKPRSLGNGISPLRPAAPTAKPNTSRSGDKEKGVEIRVDRLPEEKQLTDLLLKEGLDMRVAGPPNPLLNYIPLLLMTGLLVMLFVFMVRRMGGAGSPMAFGRSRGRLFAQEDIEITFEDVAGIEEAVDELREVVEFLKTPEKYQMLGGRIPKGVLLVGPPGTGKTLLAKAVAGEAGVPFFSLSGSDFVEMFVGVGAARVRDMFQQAEAKAPCIIFIDELDALGKTRGSGNIGGHDEREQTLNALLVEMDGFDSNSGVIVMGATNRPETLDAALLRPGRFDRHVLVDRPDVARPGSKSSKSTCRTSRSIPTSTSKRSPPSPAALSGPTLPTWSTRPPCWPPARASKVVTMADFDEAVERSSAGLEKKSRIMQDDEKLRVAYHEAGHALVAYSLPNTDPVHKVSIIPRGLAALGYTM